MRTLRFLVLAAAIAAVLAGCSSESTHNDTLPTAPTITLDAGAQGDFYPLAVGNHWTYDWSFATQLIPDEGTPEPPDVVTGTIDIDDVGLQTVGGYEYVVEEEDYSEDSGLNRGLRRQDRAGLYTLERGKDEGKSPGRPVLSSAMRARAERLAARTGASVASITAHLTQVERIRRALRGFNASPPGGPVSGEIRTLAYPLHVGASWVMLAVPSYTSTVEAHEMFNGFPAWRVRTDIEFFKDSDSAHTWFSRCGDVGRHIHFESIGVNEDGEPVGKLVTDEYTSLVDARVDRGGCDIGPAVGGGGGGGVVNSYPLAVGNRWTYEIHTTLNLDPPVTATEVVDQVQKEWVDVGDHTYLKQTMQGREPNAWISVQYLRQDRDGLYQLDPPTVPTGAPAQRGGVPLLVTTLFGGSGGKFLAVGPDAGEALLLRYPLKVGESWTMRDVPELGGKWTATVEGRERLSMPAGDFNAYRVRVRQPFQGPEDGLLIWYAPEGIVKLLAHVHTLDGPVDEEWVLTELDLAN